MRRIYVTIFLVSCAVLILEISLTRLFSIYLSYHFAFMVISIAMLGIGSAGTVLSVYPKFKNTSSITPCAVLAGAATVIGYIVSNYIPFDPVRLSWSSMQILYVALYCLVLSVPFFFSGMLIAVAFSILNEKSELIYGSDLLGAGTGSLAVIFLLNIAGPEYAVLTASSLCFAAAIVAGRYEPQSNSKRLRLVSVIFLAINLLMFITHPDFINVRLSPYKELSLSLKYPGAEHLMTYYNSFSRIDTLKSPAVRFAPGLSLTYLEPLPEQIGLSTDGGGMNAVTKADNREALRFLEFLPSALAYEIKAKGLRTVGRDALVLEPGGGQQALMAEHYSFRKVHKIESNPLIVKILRNELEDFSGKIFEHNTWSGLGRSLLGSSRLTVDGSRLYDVIDLPMTGISVTGSFGIAEDYRFTVEAFRKYLGALKKDGLMNISLYIIPPPRVELRILGTVITVLEQEGIKDVSGHIIAIRSWDSVTMLVKKTPFNKEEIRFVKDFAGARRFDLVHYPGINEDESNIYVKMPTNEYFRAFESLIDPESRQMFISDYLFDIKPVHDENPFFNYYLKLANIKVIYEVMGQKWQYFIEEGYLLPIIFVQVFILSMALIFLPVLLKKGFKPSVKKFVPKRRDEQSERSLMFPTLLYFAMLGTGFMFVEITLIQKSILLLENPAYAVTAVLTSILISSGIGSLLSAKFPKLGTRYLLPVLGGLILVYSLILPLLFQLISPHPLALKIPMVFIALTPVGFFMGVPFPTGMKALGRKNEKLIPWAWAVNGCLSVIAPILVIMLSMTMGFKTVFWFGAAAYMLAFFSFRVLTKKEP